VGVLWVTIGYTLAFGPSQSGLIGNFDFIGLTDVTSTLPDDGTVAPMAFMAFQMMFAIITPALITGAFAERAKFSTFLIFMAAWSLLVYAPVAHWVFGTGGWLSPFDEAGFATEGISALTSPAEQYIHVNAGAAASPPRSSMAGGVTGPTHGASQHQLHRPRSPEFCGSAGSASTLEALWQPTGGP
jgi:ammonia channel protein AmtB